MHALALDHGVALDTDALIAAYAPDRATPMLRMNFVSSADGAATIDGKSAPLGNDADKQVFMLLRQLCDGLMVGAGTVRGEHYHAVRSNDGQRAWRMAHGLAPDPRLVLVSSKLDLDPESRIFTDAPMRPIVLTHGASDEARRKRLSKVADVIAHGHGRVDLRAAVDELRSTYQLGQLLCEGGPHLFASLHAAGLVDELCLTLSPILAGPGADRIMAGGRRPDTPPPEPMRLAHAIVSGPDGALLLRYARV